MGLDFFQELVQLFGCSLFENGFFSKEFKELPAAKVAFEFQEKNSRFLHKATPTIWARTAVIRKKIRDLSKKIS
jgi:hypothetical protein